MGLPRLVLYKKIFHIRGFATTQMIRDKKNISSGKNSQFNSYLGFAAKHEKAQKRLEYLLLNDIFSLQK